MSDAPHDEDLVDVDLVGLEPFDQTDDMSEFDKLDLSEFDKPDASYGEDSGIITLFVDVAEQLDVHYRNLGEYEPPRAILGLTPERAVQLRDSLTKAIAQWRRDVKERAEWRNQAGLGDD